MASYSDEEYNGYSDGENDEYNEYQEEFRYVILDYVFQFPLDPKPSSKIQYNG